MRLFAVTNGYLHDFRANKSPGVRYNPNTAEVAEITASMSVSPTHAIPLAALTEPHPFRRSGRAASVSPLWPSRIRFAALAEPHPFRRSDRVASVSPLWPNRNGVAFQSQFAFTGAPAPRANRSGNSPALLLSRAAGASGDFPKRAPNTSSA